MVPDQHEQDPHTHRRRHGYGFSIAWLLAATLLVAIAAFVITSVLPDDYAMYMAPGVITVSLLLTALINPRVKKAPVLAGLVLCLAALASPMLLDWYTRNVLNDNTANIGLGLLLFAMPVLAPLAALCGVLPVGGLIGVLKPRDSHDH